MTTKTKPKSNVLAELLNSVEVIPGFDCLEMKRLGQEQIMRELEGKSEEEVREYWKQAHAELLRMQAAARAKLDGGK